MNASNPSNPRQFVEDVDEVIAEGRGLVRDARVATRDQRTPPWKTADGRARAKLKAARKRQRQARKRQR